MNKKSENTETDMSDKNTAKMADFTTSSSVSVEIPPVDVKSKNKEPKQEGLAHALVKAFAKQLDTLKDTLGEGEVILLSFSETGVTRALKKIDLKVSNPEVISVSVTWLEGDTEQRLFAAKSFSPVLAKETEASSLPEEVRSLVEQVLGHLTAHGILYTQMLARLAEGEPDPIDFLESERTRAIEVVRSANISAAGMSGNEIRNKAIAVIEQTFDSIQVGTNERRVLN